MDKNIDKRIEDLENETKNLKKIVNECKFEMKKMYLQLQAKNKDLKKNKA